MEDRSAILHETASGESSALGDFLDSHNTKTFGDTTFWPKKTPNDQDRPSPVPSTDARVRWAMMASLAGVRKSGNSGDSPNPDVKLSHGGEQPPSTKNAQNRISNSHESKRPRPRSLGPHIPVRSQSESMHERKSPNIRANASRPQERPDTLISNPTSIEQYLKNISNDPNIDDRGFRDGLQSLMPGSVDGNLGESILGSAKTPTESNKIRRTPDAKTTSPSNDSPALTSRVAQGHEKPDFQAKTSKTQDMPVLSGNSYHPSALHQQEQLPTRTESAKDWGKAPSLNGNRNQQHHRDPESAPHEGHHNTSARPQPNLNSISATRLAQAHTNVQQEPRPTLPNSGTSHEMGNASLQSKSKDNRQGLQLNRNSVPSFPPKFSPNLVKSQPAASPSFSTSHPAEVPHVSHDDIAVTSPAPSVHAPIQPLLTPPQTPRLSGASSPKKQANIQEISHNSQSLDARSPSRTSMTQDNETDLPDLQLHKSTKNLEPSLPESFEQPKTLHPSISPPNNEINRQSPAAILRAQISREREEKRQSKQQDLSVEPKASGSTSKIQSAIPRREFPKSNNAQRQEHRPPEPSNASESPHQSSQIPQNASNNVRAEHSPSPAAAIRAQVAQERAAKSQTQAKPQHHQNQHSTPAIDPPISGPQAMLNLVKDKAKASVDAAAGNPGFIDREFSSLHFPSL